jgi:hypothetical protein
MNQTKEMTSKAYFGVSDIAIVILSMDEEERFYFEYVTPSFTTFFNCNLNNLIGSNVFDIFPALPKDLYLMAKNAVINGAKEEYFVSDQILQEPIRITCYQSEPGYCTCFLERYSDYELRQNKRIGITGREVAVKDHIVGYHIGFLEDNLKHGVFLRQNYAVDFQFVTDGIFARLNQFTFFVHRRCRVVLDFVGHVFTILVGSGDSGHEIEDIAGIGCHLRLDAFNFRFECFPFFAGEKGEKNH